MRRSLAPSRRALLTAALGLTFVLPPLSSSSSLHAAEKLGKVFIKASPTTVDGQQFTDKGKDDSVEDLKKRAGKFEVVDSEKEADYLLVVDERSRSSRGNEIITTLSFKQNGQWKPGARLTASANAWIMAARRMMGQVSDWVEAQGEK